MARTTTNTEPQTAAEGAAWASASGPSLLTHVVLGITAGVLYGLVAALAGGIPAASATNAAAWAVIGALLSPLAWAGQRAVLAFPTARWALAETQAAFAGLRARGLPRTIGLRAVAAVATGAWLMVGSAFGLYALHQRTATITVAGVAGLVVVVGAAALAGAAALLLWAAASGLADALALIDRRLRLPLPLHAHPYLVVFLIAPLGVGAVVLLDLHRDDMGVLSHALDLGLLVAVEAALYPLVAFVRRRLAGTRTTLAAGFAAGGSTPGFERVIRKPDCQVATTLEAGLIFGPIPYPILRLRVLVLAALRILHR